MFSLTPVIAPVVCVLVYSALPRDPLAPLPEAIASALERTSRTRFVTWLSKSRAVRLRRGRPGSRTGAREHGSTVSGGKGVAHQRGYTQAA